ncbi:NAD(P)/FAD-dependent oxidoreductase [Jatrophihabitans endophyticus]|uniref:NAD(P)/FAD-dependent oxidoreductase n=1 Tax=Jatrophihabitans endophyticus TaxID=1206085 RepID=UPI0019FD32D6|nr:NAD(P)/FAD-dependent oxidoreductase [Jatrophihabitans endophyticus]MBE7186933.1 NAD(P)/FAD-dependent oxidoreductase [Jatrophihabitans endophyticus]
MSTDVDVVVVGARVSGSTLATLLARHGLRVAVLDKARFPSDIASTHIVQPFGVAVLERLGVRGELARRGAATLDRLLLVYDDARLEASYDSPLARATLSTGSTPGLNARRIVLDDVLLEAARDAGADVRTGTPVTGLVRDGDGRVCGVRSGDDTVTARVVVGADGRHSFVAGQVGAREYAGYPPGRLAAWGYFRGADLDANRLRIGRLGEQAWISCPAGEGLFLVGVVPGHETRDEFLADRERNFADAVRDWPELATLVEGAERVGPLRVVADWRGYLRESAGPGWVLTGDAGNFKDPAAAQGIADALRQAETLAGHVAAGLDHGDVDHETRAWWRWRDDDCRAMHWFAADMGAAGPTRPVTAQAMRDVAGDELAGVQLLQVLNRDLPPDALLTRPRLARAAGRALRRGDRRAVLSEVGAGLRDEVVRGRSARRPREFATARS